MIQLSTAGDYATVFVAAGISGLLGGLAAELLLNRNGVTGAFELPARQGVLFDLGGFASLVVGAVVGVAILVVFPPETTVVNGPNGSSATRAYDAVRLVATSLVAGSAGGSVLTALQARVTAAINESRIQWTVAAGQEQLQQLGESVKEASESTIRSLAPAPPAATARGAFGDLGQAGGAATADEAIEALNASIDRRVARATAAVSVAARATSR